MLGSRVKITRREKGLSQKELAKATGISQGSLSDIESGAVEPRETTKIALARALNDDLGEQQLGQYLNGGSSAPSKKEIAKDLSVEQLISLKFGGGGESRSKADMRALARLLDAEIAKEERIMGYPERKKK